MTQGPRLEEATSDDLPEILEIECGAYVDPWPLESFQAELGNAWSTLLVARDRDGGVVGHMVYWHVADEVQLQNTPRPIEWVQRQHDAQRDQLLIYDPPEAR